MSEDTFTFETRFQMETVSAVIGVAIGTGERTRGFVRVTLREIDEFGEFGEEMSFVLDEGEYLQLQDGIGGVLS